MTDKKEEESAKANGKLQAPANFDGRMPGHLPVMIHAQYIKDLSFENPNAPETYRVGQEGKPAMDIDFSMDARSLETRKVEMGDLYEVSLGVTVHAKRGETVLFVAEIVYGLTCSLKDVPQEKHHPFLLIEMPRYIFPYVRQLLAQLTQSAGYAPLLLTPIDFKRFYMDRFAKKAQDAEGVPADKEPEVAEA